MTIDTRHFHVQGHVPSHCLCKRDFQILVDDDLPLRATEHESGRQKNGSSEATRHNQQTPSENRKQGTLKWWFSPGTMTVFGCRKSTPIRGDTLLAKMFDI